jgi:hypothetical protein
MGVRAVSVGITLALALVGCTRARPIQAPTVLVVEGVAADPITFARVGDDGRGGSGSWKATEEVEVEWHGSWWPAVVIDRRGNRWLVHYEGYGTDWDEIVGGERIRERRLEAEPSADEDDDSDVDP